MYKKGFFIENPVGNNVFSFEKRQNKRLFVPSIKKISNISEIKLQGSKGKIAFEDFDFNGKLSTNYGLNNFYKFKNVVFFDNHNHAFYFWYEAREKGIIGDNCTLIHIDEHSDLKYDGEFLTKKESKNLKRVFDFTNFKLNVGNYIIPAQKEGLIGKVIQIRNTTNLKDYLKNTEKINSDIILNLDLDFFNPNLDFIDYNLKKEVILGVFSKAKLVTVSSSPFFIDQNLALKVFRDLFPF